MTVYDVYDYLLKVDTDNCEVVFESHPEERDPAFFYDYHLHKYWELKFCAKEPAGKGHLLRVLHPGLVHCMTRHDLVLAISFQMINIVSESGEHIWKFHFSEDTMERINLLPKLLQALVSCTGEKRTERLRRDLVRAIISNILLVIEVGGEAAEAAARGRSIVEIAKDYMENCYYKADLSVADIARFVGVSPQYLNSAFRKATGRTTRQTLVESRLEHARELLATSLYTVKEVASLTGWHSQFYFSNSYHKHFGIPPKHVTLNNIGIE